MKLRAASTVSNWTENWWNAESRYMPGIIHFLGYNPLPVAKGVIDRLVRHRTTMGLSKKNAARRLGVDPCTLANWDRGERIPTGAFGARVERFLETQGTT